MSLVCTGAGGHECRTQLRPREPRAASPGPVGWPKGPARSGTHPVPTPCGGGGTCLLEEQRAELWLRGRILQRGARRLGLKEKGGPGLRLSPGHAEGTLVQREVQLPRWQAGAARAASPPFIICAEHLQSINGLINSLQRPLNYSSSGSSDQSARSQPGSGSGVGAACTASGSPGPSPQQTRRTLPLPPTAGSSGHPTPGEAAQTPPARDFCPTTHRGPEPQG